MSLMRTKTKRMRTMSLMSLMSPSLEGIVIVAVSCGATATVGVATAENDSTNADTFVMQIEIGI